MKEIIKNKKKVIIPSILVLVLIIGGAVYGLNHNKPIEKKPAKKAVHKVKEKNKPEASSEAVPSESATSSSEASKPVENSKPSKAEKKAEKNSSAKSGSVAASSGGSSSGSSSSTQASKPKEPIYGTRTVQKAVQVYDPMKESYIQCACGCRNPSREHLIAHAEKGEPSNTKRVYVGGYVTKYETVTERYIIGYK